MLTELNIRNFAIIDELQVSFAEGLNVISGETGAGKSILIGAVGLLLGDRASADMIRSNEDAAAVEALFQIGRDDETAARIRERGFGEGDELVIRRVVSRSGKNRVYINGTLAPLAALAEIGESLINICGQHEHQQILNPERHIDILDGFGGLLPLRTSYRELYDRHRSLNDRLRELEAQRRQRAEREELLRFQSEEIGRADLKAGEDESLAEERKVLTNVQKLIDLAGGAHETLYGRDDAVLARFRAAAAAVREIHRIDPSLKLTDAEMDEVYYRIEEAAFTLRDYGGHLAFDPARLAAVEDRLELLGRLKRKYGGSLAAVLAKGAEAEAELGRIASVDGEVGSLAAEVAAARQRLREAGELLTDKRHGAAAAMKRTIEAEIRTLGMDKAQFAVLFRRPSGEEPACGEKGMDDPEFHFSANVGEDLKPLKSIASGGELSRIMLALKKGLARTGSVGTIVFDEVDSGIGGATAEIVGRKLKEVSRHHQVLCITHLPQIACYGDRHYRVAKGVSGGRTTTAIGLLPGAERLEEIARMLGGVAVTEKTRDHAREMLLAAQG